MIRVNFLSVEYRQKIFLRKFATFAGLVLTLIVVSIMAVGLVLDDKITKKIADRDALLNDIMAIKAKTVDIKKSTESILDLSNKIQIIDDILNQKKYGFSEVIYRLQQNVPEGVSLKSLTYDGTNLVINGVATENSSKGLSAERNLLSFERNLRDTPSYYNIIPEYSKAVNNGEDMREFKMTITLINE